MQVLKAVDPNTAAGKTKELFGAIEQRLKRVPNMIQLMGNSPAILGAYLGFNQAFEETKITPKIARPDYNDGLRDQWLRLHAIHGLRSRSTRGLERRRAGCRPAG